VIDEVIVDNSDAIHRIKKEIKEIMEQRVDTSNQSTDKEATNQVGQKKCKFFNRGHCKYVKRCRNFHPNEICSTYLGGKMCYQSCCQKDIRKSVNGG
jgi:hypothetical protein